MSTLTICIILSPERGHQRVDGLSACRGRLVELPFEDEDRVALSLQLGVLLQTSVLRGRDSAEAAGCDLPDGFGDNLVVTHGHQEQGFGY